MKNKRLSIFWGWLAIVCLAVGCLTVFSIFSILFEDKLKCILWSLAIDILIVSLVVWNPRFADNLGKRGRIALLVVRIALPVFGVGLFIFNALHYIPQTDVAALLIAVMLFLILGFIFMYIWLTMDRNAKAEKDEAGESRKTFKN